MIRYAYNAQLQPPAPFVRVTLRHHRTGAEAQDVPAQLDTAADRTLLPLTVVQALGLDAIGDLLIGGVGGTVAVMPVYAVQLGIHTLPPTGLEVVTHPNESWVMLGRDVLNAYRMVFDGPNRTLEIS